MLQYLVHNLSAAHVLVDKDFNPLVVDFAMILGGGLVDGRFTGLPAVLRSHGYEDINVVAIGMWTAGNDVFALGVVLLELILQSTSAGLTKALRCPHLVFIHEVAYGLYVGEQARAKERESKFSYLKKLCLCAHPRAEE
ncbi:Non-specific serine/threonine protein kinase [Handroanthus impetiginosus]|uniref:Non-specific serine/threonine protein kinase n=1 Tax=Handroanthus impetiginosus TaxID=429701 RepID=A0A2G9H8U0_9LAMI|nr:Non-specific serine/threonine protein kinase [Handroanthus impetiginosus]